MLETRTNCPIGDRFAETARRFGILGLAVLGMSALTACDLNNLLAIGGEGRTAGRVDQPRDGVAAEDVRTVQRELARLGYAPGPVDGLVGAKTRSAIRRYQEVAGLRVDGRITPELLAQLKANPVPSPDSQLPPPDIGRAIVRDDLVIDSAADDLPPIYETGDVFAWSDGLVETVIRTGGDRVFWRGSDGSSFNAGRNFIMPATSWDQPSGPGSTTVRTRTKNLWPVRPGKWLQFEVLTTGPSGIVSERRWTCMPQGKRKVTVPAGTFDTQVITCERSSVDATEWRYRTWFYAPAARHYVRRVDRFNDGSIRAVGLVAIRPGGKGWPDAARAGLDWAIQDALTEQSVGSGAEWSSTSVRANFTIMPTGARKMGDGNGCRTFVLIRQAGDESRSYPAIACQNVETGVWLVPVLDEGAPPANEVLTLG